MPRLCLTARNTQSARVISFWTYAACFPLFLQKPDGQTEKVKMIPRMPASNLARYRFVSGSIISRLSDQINRHKPNAYRFQRERNTPHGKLTALIYNKNTLIPKTCQRRFWIWAAVLTRCTCRLGVMISCHSPLLPFLILTLTCNSRLE